ncbi:FG-GAP repeat domain-containing protein, partial [Candidatus Latescibacterota bacterium]
IELLDGDGKLVRRMPQFWGDSAVFTIIDGPDKSLNLLAARINNDYQRIGIVNNKILDPSVRGFDSVPQGHTFVGGWASQDRHHLFYDDINGDGVKEVISEINGSWNRVQVWTPDGKPLYDATLGPGERPPVINLRDLDIADFDGDGKKEIVAATFKGFVIMLDNQCRKIWSKRLPKPPSKMKCITPLKNTPPLIIVGCEDGSVFVLNGKGDIIKKGSIGGNPTCIDEIELISGGNGVLLSTDNGDVVLFNLSDKDTRR